MPHESHGGLSLQNDVKSIRIAADVGGTSTDVVVIDQDGSVWTRKVPSTPPDFERAVLSATDTWLRESGLAAASVSSVCHGTTVASNALLARRGARTALITTRGFRDVLELRRVRAPQVYDLFFDKPPVIINHCLRLELNERMSANGTVLSPVDFQELERLCEQLEREQVESLAVCLLHSYTWPRHEKMVGEYLRERFPQQPVSLSCEVLRERREYERTATTAVNAYVRPVVARYLGAMQTGCGRLISGHRC